MSITSKNKLYTKKEIEKLGINNCLSEFSEGNANLKELLFYFYINNIQTIACCAGHDDPSKDSYIFIRLKNKHLKNVYNFINNNFNQDYKVSFIINHTFFKCNTVSFRVPYKNEKSSSTFFKNILLSFKEPNCKRNKNLIIKFLKKCNKNDIKFKHISIHIFINPINSKIIDVGMLILDDINISKKVPKEIMDFYRTNRFIMLNLNKIDIETALIQYNEIINKFIEIDEKIDFYLNNDI